MKYILYMLFGLAALSSCIENRELPYNGLYTEPGYFIECYLVPGEQYSLSATKLQPLYEDYILDYSLAFDVWVDTVQLQQGLFKQSGTSYLYNYGHYYLFNPASKRLAQLVVVTPDKDTIRGLTSIPEQVKILNAGLDDKVLKFDFVLSADSRHNHYMINLCEQQEDTVYRENRFFDYSHNTNEDTIHFKDAIVKGSDYYSLNVVLRRMSRANYDYQISLQNAKDANRDNLILPSPLVGNLKNAIGIFTCFTCDSVGWDIRSEK